MSLARPQIESFVVFDAREDNTINYSVRGGDQVGGYILEIYNNSNNSLAYSKKVVTLIPNMEIPANSLSNGIEYKVRVKTVDPTVLPDFSNVGSNNSSPFSDYMILKCYSKPSVNIVNIPIDDSGERVIRNQNFTFEGIHQQAEGVQLKSFRYLFYDSERVLIESFPETYQLTGKLMQDVSNMRNNGEYFIELYTIDQYDKEFSSGLTGFRVDFIRPRMKQVMQLENDYKNALVKIESKVVQIILKAENHTFEDGEWIDVRNGRVWIGEDSEFNIESDFTCELYCRQLKENEVFMTMRNRSGTISFIVYDDRIHGFRKRFGSTVVSHYSGDVILNYDTNSTLFIFIQQQDGRFNIRAEMVGDSSE